MSEKISILIVDDHPVIGFAIELLIKKHFFNADVNTVTTGKESLQFLKKKPADLVILDVNLPDYNILSLIPNMHLIAPDQKILVFTMTPENILAKRLFLMNVMGFLSKNVSNEVIIDAIRKILKGEHYISEGFSKQMMQDLITGNNETDPLDALSDREFQILKELLQGKTLREISEEAHLHISSINTYKSRIYKKLNIKNQMELFNKAKSLGII